MSKAKLSRRGLLAALAASPAAVEFLRSAIAEAQTSLSQSGLVGEIQGPTIITDPAKWPKKFAEAPMLAELVKAETAAGRGARSRRTVSVAAVERDRQVRRHLATRVHWTGGWRERQPHPVVRQAAALERGWQQDRALRRQGIRAQRRREDLYAVPAQRHEVVRRFALHRR